MDDSQNAGQHFQGQHTGFVHDYQVGGTPVDAFTEKVIVRDLAQSAVDGTGPQAGAVCQIAGRLARGRTEHHAPIDYCPVLNQHPD